MRVVNQLAFCAVWAAASGMAVNPYSPPAVTLTSRWPMLAIEETEIGDEVISPRNKRRLQAKAQRKKQRNNRN